MYCIKALLDTRATVALIPSLTSSGLADAPGTTPHLVAVDIYVDASVITTLTLLFCFHSNNSHVAARVKY